ncbi:ubiquitin-protein ligase [Lithospermum erythrorhizon]|uniref:Protein yippee-like n=1 Tax=Lithospermum erythrorhizon TaxID=34254 RepID=A0AAV3PFF3_LITER
MAENTDRPFYSCKICRAPIATANDLLSKTFKAKTGQAYMFEHAMNIVMGKKEEKQLLTGYFTIANVDCGKCGASMGWYYVRAWDERQKYKEGRYIIEKAKILKEY